MELTFTLIRKDGQFTNYIECPSLRELNLELKKQGLHLEIQYLNEKLNEAR